MKEQAVLQSAFWPQLQIYISIMKFYWVQIKHSWYVDLNPLTLIKWTLKKGAMQGCSEQHLTLKVHWIYTRVFPGLLLMCQDQVTLTAGCPFLLTVHKTVELENLPCFRLQRWGISIVFSFCVNVLSSTTWSWFIKTTLGDNLQYKGEVIIMIVP